ncbi:class I SAM-dependent methyltransferase [Methylibium sp.]|uniref:class I SAM-dependent methyltransferase n=1 Tax=Methylibium sp. TaxID=2067992 RepID=UPI00182D7722|nr:class I SAM-dependent methyltransferase [Methylibium sp.]MBA3589296.1 class I SAM-dependent methyltransferase [Methylibium sp.]
MSVFDSLAARATRARFERNQTFLRLISTMTPPLRMLDVGGTVGYWSTAGLPLAQGIEVVLLNSFEQHVDGPFSAVVGDARDLSKYRPREFDIVFSNSVIGHVGNFADQRRMADEIQRVGKHFFLQTPNHRFPLDWRTLMPFFHFLPARVQAWFFARVPVGRYRRASGTSEATVWATRIRNLNREEVGLLFPGAKVIDETVFGFTKSFLVHNFPV